MMFRKKKKETPYWKYPAVQSYMKNYNKMYYLANRDKIIADSKRRNRDNEDIIKKYQKGDYAENRNKLLDYAKKKRK